MRKTFLLLLLMGMVGASMGQISISPTLINFFTVFQSQPDSIQVTISNNKPVDPLHVTDIHFYHTDAFYVQERSFTVPAGQSKTIWVYCNPRHNVQYKDFMTVETSTDAEVLNAFLFAQGKYLETYYDGTMNKWDEDLQSTLKTVISFGYTTLTYNGARDEIFMHIDNQAFNGQGAAQNTLECIYTGQTAVGYTDRTDCQNNYNFNTEHTVPQSLFSQNLPMVSDMHHLFATTASSNTERGNNPYGIVTNPSWSVGGSKSNGNVFEPRDAHKGKAARAMLYFLTRYQDFSNFIGSQEALMRSWCAQFLPTQVEKDRNDDIFALQNNRNPYIDHPEFLERITSLAGTGTRPNVPDVYLGADSLHYKAPFPGGQTGYFILSNQGLDTLHFSNITFSNPVFSLVGSPLLSIPPDSARTVYVHLTPTAAGQTYDETVTFNTDDAQMPSMTVTLLGQSIVVGNAEPTAADVQVYPNPATETVHLRLGHASTDAEFVSIVDLTGKELRRFHLPAGTVDFGMDVAELPKGCYLLKVNLEGMQVTRKLILN